MTDPLTTAPPWVAFALAAVAVLALPRRLGTTVAVALTALTAPWVAATPPGTAVAVSPFSYEQVLFRVDPFTRPLAVLFGVVAALNVLYGHATGADARQTGYSLCYMGAGVAAVLAGDWLTLLMAWELLALCATVLVWHRGGEAVRPAFRYAVYHLVGGAFLAAGVSLHYAATGTFVYDGGFTSGLPTTLALAGVGVNLAFVGLHSWLPETYSRPHVAASVVLAGFTTKVAVYVLARLAPGGDAFVAWMGAAMVLYGVTQAVLQTDTRRLLSYHVVSQVGYMTVAVGVGTAAGLTGAFAHLAANVLYKGLLFMIAGAILARTGESSLKRLGGLARRMPATFAAFLVAAFAISGLPGFSGFVSKGLVTKAVESAGPEPLWWALVVGSVGTALSFAKFGYYAFVREAPEPLSVRPASRVLAPVLLLAAVPSVALGLFPGAFLGLFPGDPGGFDPYAASELTKAVATVGAGVAAFALFRSRLSRLPAVDVDRWLHPAAARAAVATASLFVRAGAGASALGDALIRRLAPTVGRDSPTTDTAIHAALLALTATTAVALVVAVLG